MISKLILFALVNFPFSCEIGVHFYYLGCPKKMFLRLFLLVLMILANAVQPNHPLTKIYTVLFQLMITYDRLVMLANALSLSVKVPFCNNNAVQFQDKSDIRITFYISLFFFFGTMSILYILLFHLLKYIFSDKENMSLDEGDFNVGGFYMSPFLRKLSE